MNQTPRSSHGERRVRAYAHVGDLCGPTCVSTDNVVYMTWFPIYILYRVYS